MEKKNIQVSERPRMLLSEIKLKSSSLKGFFPQVQSDKICVKDVIISSELNSKDQSGFDFGVLNTCYLFSFLNHINLFNYPCN